MMVSEEFFFPLVETEFDNVVQGVMVCMACKGTEDGIGTLEDFYIGLYSLNLGNMKGTFYETML